MGQYQLWKENIILPPMSQMKMNTPSKLCAPPNLPTFSGQEPVPSTEGSVDQWLFQVEGALATHTGEVVGQP